jgi:CBS domain-containing protein
MADMVRDQEPLVLPPESTVQEACRRMRERRVGAVLVAEHGRRLVGIFTGRDAVCRVLAEARRPETTRLADVMTRDPATLTRDKSALDALLMMQDGGFRHLPIVERGHIYGIVSRGDFRGLEQARLDEETGFAERVW